MLEVNYHRVMCERISLDEKGLANHIHEVQYYHPTDEFDIYTLPDSSLNKNTMNKLCDIPASLLPAMADGDDDFTGHIRKHIGIVYEYLLKEQLDA